MSLYEIPTKNIYELSTNKYGMPHIIQWTRITPSQTTTHTMKVTPILLKKKAVKKQPPGPIKKRPTTKRTTPLMRGVKLNFDKNTEEEEDYSVEDTTSTEEFTFSDM